MATDLYEAIRERRDRACEVREDYETEYVGCQCWVVQHPDEPERCYLVDMIERRCTCPDWSCTAHGLGIDCKHIVAIGPMWEEFTGQVFHAQAAPPFGMPGHRTVDCAGFRLCVERDPLPKLVLPDPNDPYQD